MTNVLFDKNPAETSGRDIVDAFAGDDRFTRLPRVEVVGHDIVQVAVAAKAVKSKCKRNALQNDKGIITNSKDSFGTKTIDVGRTVPQQPKSTAKRSYHTATGLDR